MARRAASCSVSCASYFAASRKVLHKNAFSDEAASFYSAMKHFPFHSKYEALRSRSVWWKNEKWELCLQIFLVYATLFSGKENSHGIIVKQTRWSFNCICSWNIESCKISERTERNDHLQSNRQSRNKYRSQHPRSAICSRESWFCFKTANCLERSQWNKLLVAAIGKNKNPFFSRIWSVGNSLPGNQNNSDRLNQHHETES